MRFDVTVPTPAAPTEHRGLTPAAVAELVDHAATHGLRLHIRPTRSRHLADRAADGAQE